MNDQTKVKKIVKWLNYFVLGALALATAMVIPSLSL